MDLNAGRCLGIVLIAVIALVWLLPKSAQANEKAVEPAIYLVRHSSIGVPLSDQHIAQLAYYQVSVDAAARGAHEVRLQPLWARQKLGDNDIHYLFELEPAESDDARVIAVLNGGFASTITAKGDAAAPVARDQAAWRALRTHDAAAAEQWRTLHQAPGLRPVTLPDNVKVGDTVAGQQRIEPIGRFDTRMRVEAVTPAEVLLQMTVDTAQVKGNGRLVVRRDNGMPIELRMEVEQGAHAGEIGTVYHVHLADMAYDPMLEFAQDLDVYRGYMEQLEQTLGQPPFSAPSDDAAAYALATTAVGQLEAHMVAQETLAALERSMEFGWVPSDKLHQHVLGIGARMQFASPDLSYAAPPDPLLIATPTSVQALDSDGTVIPGAAPWLVQRRMFLPRDYAAAEHDPQFPFHLPLGTSAWDMTRMATIRMQVEAEVYAWDAVETIDAGAQSAINANVRISRPAAHRVSIEQGRAALLGNEGLWTVAVPLDAQGNMVPFVQQSMVPVKRSTATTAQALPLAWESRDEPYRLEIATQQSVEKLQLRHYRWKTVPRTWEFKRDPPVD